MKDEKDPIIHTISMTKYASPLELELINFEKRIRALEESEADKDIVDYNNLCNIQNEQINRLRDDIYERLNLIDNNIKNMKENIVRVDRISELINCMTENQEYLEDQFNEQFNNLNRKLDTLFFITEIHNNIEDGIAISTLNNDIGHTFFKRDKHSKNEIEDPNYLIGQILEGLRSISFIDKLEANKMDEALLNKCTRILEKINSRKLKYE